MFITFLSTAALMSSLPNYKTEILARANGSNTFNLPAYAVLNSTTPSLNDSGEVAFSVISGGIDQDADHSGKSALWLKTRKDMDGRIVYFSPTDKIVNDVKMIHQGQVLFSQFDEMTTDGLFLFDAVKQNAEQIFANKKMAALNYPQITGNTAYIFRSTDQDKNRKFFEFHNRQLVEVANEDEGYSYLFGPNVNDSSQWVFKARLGEKYNVQENAADQIVLLTPHFTALGQKSYQKTILAEDADANVMSAYQAFDNSPAITNAGYVVFTATLKNKIRSIIAVKNGVNYVVAREGENEISQIELFSPQINDNGLVVFRAKNQKGLRGIYLANPFSVRPEIRRLLGEGDAIETDQGRGAILKHENFPGFGGNVDINNENEIAFSAVVATENQKWILGTAIYKLHPL